MTRGGCAANSTFCRSSGAETGALWCSDRCAKRAASRLLGWPPKKYSPLLALPLRWSASAAYAAAASAYTCMHDSQTGGQPCSTALPGRPQQVATMSPHEARALQTSPELCRTWA